MTNKIEAWQLKHKMLETWNKTIRPSTEETNKMIFNNSKSKEASDHPYDFDEFDID